MSAKCLEKNCREIVKLNQEDGNCGFYPIRSTAYQIFTLKQIFEIFLDVQMIFLHAFVDPEKAYDRFLEISSVECCSSMN